MVFAGVKGNVLTNIPSMADLLYICHASQIACTGSRGAVTALAAHGKAISVWLVPPPSPQIRQSMATSS